MKGCNWSGVIEVEITSTEAMRFKRQTSIKLKSDMKMKLIERDR